MNHNHLFYKFGNLDFEIKKYLDSFDWYNLPEEAKKMVKRKHDRLEGQGRRKLYADDKVFVFVNELPDDDYFKVNIFRYIDEVLKLDKAEAGISYFPPTEYEKGGTSTGWHMDTHTGYMDRRNARFSEEEKYKKIARYWVPLNDRSFGHFFEMSDHKDNFMIADWKGGDVYRLFPKFPHVAASLGPEERILMIITGVIRD